MSLRLCEVRSNPRLRFWIASFALLTEAVYLVTIFSK